MIVFQTILSAFLLGLFSTSVLAMNLYEVQGTSYRNYIDVDSIEPISGGDGWVVDIKTEVPGGKWKGESYNVYWQKNVVVCGHPPTYVAIQGTYWKNATRIHSFDLERDKVGVNDANPWTDAGKRILAFCDILR